MQAEQLAETQRWQHVASNLRGSNNDLNTSAQALRAAPSNIRRSWRSTTTTFNNGLDEAARRLCAGTTRVITTSGKVRRWLKGCARRTCTFSQGVAQGVAHGLKATTVGFSSALDGPSNSVQSLVGVTCQVLKVFWLWEAFCLGGWYRTPSNWDIWLGLALWPFYFYEKPSWKARRR